MSTLHPKMPSKWHPKTSLFATFGIRRRWKCRKRNVSEKNALKILPKNTEQMPKRAPKKLPFDQTLVFTSPMFLPTGSNTFWRNISPKKSQTLGFCKRKRKRQEGRGKKEEESRRKGGRGEKEDGRRKRKEGWGRGNKEEKRMKGKEGREKKERRKRKEGWPKPITFPNQHIFDEHANG